MQNENSEGRRGECKSKNKEGKRKNQIERKLDKVGGYEAEKGM